MPGPLTLPTARRARDRLLLTCLTVSLAGTAALAPAALAAKTTKLSAEPATAQSAKGCRAARGSLLAGGSCDWTTTLQFTLPAATPDAARLRLSLKGSTRGTLRVAAAAATAATSRAGKTLRGTVRLDVLGAVTGRNRRVALTVSATSASTIRISSAGLELALGAASGADPSVPGGSPAPSTGGKPTPAPDPAAAPTPGPAPAPVPAPSAPGVPASPPAAPRPPVSGASVWVGADDLRSLPVSGAAYAAVKSAADGSFDTPDVADQNSDHDVDTLAAALVFARTGVEGYRSKVNAAISGAIGTEVGGRTLALGRNLVSYVIAADLIDLPGADPVLDARFRAWIAAARTEDLQGLTLIETHEKRPNNWGTMAGASRIAVDLYLGDGTDLARAAEVFRGYLGDRSAYTGFAFGDTSYQADPTRPVGINPAGATKSGVDIDGAIPDDMRRGCSFQPVPCHTDYAWEAMQGVVVQAELLSRHGMPAFAWSDAAVLRAAEYLQRLDAAYGGWWAAGDDTWQPWLINHAYGTHLAATDGGPGKVFGWTDWVYGT